MKLAVSQDLEHCLVHAVCRGLIPLSELCEVELSKSGRVIFEGITYLSKTHEPPFAPKAVVAAAIDILGGDPSALHDYMAKAAFADDGKEAEGLLDSIRQKQALTELINKAGEQLSAGNLNASELLAVLERGTARAVPASLASLVRDKLPDLPSGELIKTLPKLTQATGGLFGFWAIGGKAGAGKSTMAIQLSLEFARRYPVLYYDFEQGPEAILSHLGIAFKGDVKEVRRVTERLHIRDTMKTLSTDLSLFKPPALIVVDSIQKVPTSVEHRRSSLDIWVHRFEALKRRGYTVLAVSELNRAGYTHMAQESYKETGELEYSADVGLQIRNIDKTNDIEVHCVKNRHRPNLGHLLDLYRMDSWLFSEVFKRG